MALSTSLEDYINNQKKIDKAKADMDKARDEANKENTERTKANIDKEAENQKTKIQNVNSWGKLGKFFSGSIKNWANERIKNNGIIGKSLQASNEIWKSVFTQVQIFGSKLTSQIREVLGPVADLLDTIHDSFKNTLKFTKGLYNATFKNTADAVLNDTLDFFKAQAKKDEREGTKTGKTTKTFQAIMLGLGLIVGSIVGVIVKPFTVLYKTLKYLVVLTTKIGKFLKMGSIGNQFSKLGLWIKSFFTAGTKFGKILTWTSKKFTSIAKFFISFAKGTGKFAKVLRWIGKFLTPLTKGFMIGFKRLAWPLTAVIAVIDGVVGVIKSLAEGNTWGQAAIDGLKAIFMGFWSGMIELTVLVIGKLLGWNSEKINKWTENIKNIFSNVFDFIANSILFITNFIKNQFEKFRKIARHPFDFIGEKIFNKNEDNYQIPTPTTYRRTKALPSIQTLEKQKNDKEIKY